MKAFDRISVLHLMVGGLQAILAYGLYQSAELSVWPATHAAAYIPLFMVMVFLPLSFYCASDAMAVKRWLLSISVASVSALVGLHQGLTASSIGRRGDVASDWTPAHVGDYLAPALILAIPYFCWPRRWRCCSARHGASTMVTGSTPCSAMRCCCSRRDWCLRCSGACLPLRPACSSWLNCAFCRS